MAKATVLSVTKGKMKDRWSGYFFKYQPDPYKGQTKDPVEKFVFENAKEIVAQIQNLEAGDYVEVRQEKDAKGYWQLVGVAKLDSNPKRLQGNNNAPSGKKPFVDNTESIQKQVCLKEASAIVQCLIANDRVFKKTEKPELIADAVVDMANNLNQLFVGKLEIKSDDKDIVKDSVYDGDIEDDDEIPF